MKQSNLEKIIFKGWKEESQHTAEVKNKNSI